MSFSTLRSILSSDSTPSINSRSIDHNLDATPKIGNKRKAAFEAWHQKKLAQMKTDHVSSSTSDSPKPSPPPPTDPEVTRSHLRHFLLSAPAPLRSTIDSSSINDHRNRSAPDLTSIKDRRNGSTPDLASMVSSTQSNTAAAAKNLTAPKLSRHNDAAFYPNIQCILCHEWVCSRNRYMHIESHFQYRPYKCSVCGYDNRKQIFIELHINRVHKGAAQILYHPDSELEKRAWTMAEQCLQHTRQVLLRRQMDGGKEADSTSPSSTTTSAQEKSINTDRSITCSSTSPIDKDDPTPLMAPYTGVYRPKIYNNQRSEKSHLIEESRQLGLIPDFSDVTAREERCRLCDSHVLRTPALLEEHARTHLSRPSYGCSMNSCPVHHHSRNFIIRHMKEVHRVRRGIHDLLEHDRHLLDEYLATCGRCFPGFFASTTSVPSGAEGKGDKTRVRIQVSMGDQAKSKGIEIGNANCVVIGDQSMSISDPQSKSAAITDHQSKSIVITDYRSKSMMNNNQQSNSMAITDQHPEPDGQSRSAISDQLKSNSFISKQSMADRFTNGTNFIADQLRRNDAISTSDQSLNDTRSIADHLKSTDRTSGLSISQPRSISTDQFQSFSIEKVKSDSDDLRKSITSKSTIGDQTSKSISDQCQGCKENLTLFAHHFQDDQCVSCRHGENSKNGPSSTFMILVCDLCDEQIVSTDHNTLLMEAESHSLKHCYTLPFQCIHCPFIHWRKSDLDFHYDQNHRGDTKLFFRWQSTHDWRQMWSKTFEECFAGQMISDQGKSISCLECTRTIPSGRHDRFEHCIRRHSPDQVIDRSILERCGYCGEQTQPIGSIDSRGEHDRSARHRGQSADQEHRSIIDQTLLDHLKSVHYRLPQLKCYSITFRQEINADQAKDHLRSCLNRCFDKSQPTKMAINNQEIGDRSMTTAKSVFCQLCHVDVPDDPASHIVHLQYHLQAPIYKCRACPYMDVDVDRMKEHVDTRHQGKVPYYAETLPLDQESKALKLMEWCFRLSF